MIWLKLSTHRYFLLKLFSGICGKKTDLFICSHSLKYSVQRLQTSDHIQRSFYSMKFRAQSETVLPSNQEANISGHS